VRSSSGKNTSRCDCKGTILTSLRYFEENPTELSHLRHDGELRTARQQAHLKHIPEYLLPKDGKQALTGDVGFVALRKDKKGKGKKGRGFKVGSRKRDPLKTFKARRKTK
jgi:ATP-dependent RNA helicase DDX56/DBP9